MGPSCIRAGPLTWAWMAAGPGLGPPGPHMLSVYGDRLPEEEPSRPQSADSLTAGAQRDAEEEEVTPPLPKSSGSVISSGPAGARGYETLGSLWSRQPGA